VQANSSFFWCIADFGNLAVTLLTTTRKFFTITFSVLWFRHEITDIQKLCIGLVFFALMVDCYFSYVDHQEKEKGKEKDSAKIA